MKYSFLLTKHQTAGEFRECIDKKMRRRILCRSAIHNFLFDPSLVGYILEAVRVQSAFGGKLYGIPAETKEDIDSMILFKLIAAEDIIAEFQPMELETFLDTIYAANKVIKLTPKIISWGGDIQNEKYRQKVRSILNLKKG